MREFFRGWRRKLGCVTLGFACLLVFGWIRSGIVEDVFSWKGYARELAIVSFDSSLGLCVWDIPSRDALIGWRTEPLNRSKRDAWVGVPGAPFNVGSLPYWVITIPLTLLSAVLLLWPSREAGDEKQAS
jgi:hypothetical protein